MSDNVIDFYNNHASYTPPCCRPGGRCTVPHEIPDIQLSEADEDRLTVFINNGASMGDVITFWRELKEKAAHDH